MGDHSGLLFHPSVLSKAKVLVSYPLSNLQVWLLICHKVIQGGGEVLQPSAGQLQGHLELKSPKGQLCLGHRLVSYSCPIQKLKRHAQPLPCPVPPDLIPKPCPFFILNFSESAYFSPSLYPHPIPSHFLSSPGSSFPSSKLSSPPFIAQNVDRVVFLKYKSMSLSRLKT